MEQFKNFITANSRKGAKCAEYGVFTADSLQCSRISRGDYPSTSSCKKCGPNASPMHGEIRAKAF
jgi:hypothetical protein